MLIPFNKDDYEVVTTHETCPFHKKHPGESYAGCTCSGSYGLKRKPVPKVKTKPNMCMRKQESNDKALAPATTLGTREQSHTQTGLAPCPFCGEDRASTVWESCEPMSEGDTDRVWFIECDRCGAQGPVQDFQNKCAEPWNKRVPLTSSPSTESTDTVRKEKAGVAQPQVAEGKAEPVAQSGWIKTAKRPPTKEDADENGMVLARRYYPSGLFHETIRRDWDAVADMPDLYVLWLPIPPVEGQQKDLGER